MTIPENLDERRKYILDQVIFGEYELKWTKIQSLIEGHSATFFVTEDALKIEGYRVGLDAELQQQIADLLGLVFPTPKILDLMWAQAVRRIDPCTMPVYTAADSAKMDTIDWMKQYNAKVDAALAALPETEGLVSNSGKHWMIDEALLKHPGMAENYGWYTTSNPWKGIACYPTVTGVKSPSGSKGLVIQPPSWAHNLKQIDYSQTGRYVWGVCVVDDQPMVTKQLLVHADLAWLASHTGAMTVLRQPGVAEMEPLDAFQRIDPTVEG